MRVLIHTFVAISLTVVPVVTFPADASAGMKTDGTAEPGEGVDDAKVDSPWQSHVGGALVSPALMLGTSPGAALIGNQPNDSGGEQRPDHMSVTAAKSLDLELSEETPAETDPSLVWQQLSPSYASATPLPYRGHAMYYNPGVMREVIAYRLKTSRITPCVECIGYIAMLRAGDLNRRVWLQLDESTFEGPYLVTDVAAAQHVGQLLEKGWAVDVDYRTARRWNMKMPYVTVWEDPPLDLFLARDTLPLMWNGSPVPSRFFSWAPRSADLAVPAYEGNAGSVRKRDRLLWAGDLLPLYEAPTLDYYVQ